MSASTSRNEDDFKAAVRLFIAEKYEEALMAFNEVEHKYGGDPRLHDSKAATLEKLDRITEALKETRRTIDLNPKTWQGYARSARLFLKINRTASALKMADLALERVKPGDTKRRQEIEAVRDQALSLQTCHFAKLPYEIMGTIFTLIAKGSEARVLALSLVCRSWRSTILETPGLWRKLIVTKKTPTKKITEWVKRSRGRIHEVKLMDMPTFDARQRAFTDLQWDQVQSLSLSAIIGSDSRQISLIPDEISEKLHLQELIVYLSMEKPQARRVFFTDILGTMDISCLRAFEIQSNATFTPDILMETTMLRRLVLNCKIMDQLPRCPYYLLDILEGQIKLEELEIHSVSSSAQTPIAQLNNLRSLRLVESSTRLLGGIQCPNLECLELDMGHVPIDSLSNEDFSKLQKLHLQHCAIEASSIIQLLEKAENLRILELSACNPDAALVLVLNELGSPERSRASNSAGAKGFLCPRLEYLCVKDNSSLTSTPITKLVKFRLESQTTSSTGDEGDISLDDSSIGCSKLKTLDISDCPSVNPDVLPWLRDKVPHVVYKMTKEKRGKTRRAPLL